MFYFYNYLILKDVAHWY